MATLATQEYVSKCSSLPLITESPGTGAVSPDDVGQLSPCKFVRHVGGLRAAKRKMVAMERLEDWEKKTDWRKESTCQAQECRREGKGIRDGINAHEFAKLNNRVNIWWGCGAGTTAASLNRVVADRSALLRSVKLVRQSSGRVSDSKRGLIGWRGCSGERDEMVG